MIEIAVIVLGLSMFVLGMISQYAVTYLATQKKPETFTAPF